MRNLLKKIIFLRVLYAIYLASKTYFTFKPIPFVRNLFWYNKDFAKLKKSKNPNFKISNYHKIICIDDKTTNTSVEPIYFLQNNWASKKIFEIKPDNLVDVGSSVNWIGIISQFVPVTFIDIRPIDIEIKEIEFKKGSILQLPFESNTISCISSLCVVEHIGLGRYGDPVDAFGSEKAVKELIRVTKKKGHILFSVPVDKENIVYFNAHRAFTREYLLTLFENCELKEEKYIYGKLLESNYKEEFGTGLYWFIKR